LATPTWSSAVCRSRTKVDTSSRSATWRSSCSAKCLASRYDIVRTRDLCCALGYIRDLAQPVIKFKTHYIIGYTFKRSVYGLIASVQYIKKKNYERRWLRVFCIPNRIMYAPVKRRRSVLGVWQETRYLHWHAMRCEGHIGIGDIEETARRWSTEKKNQCG